MSIETKIDDLIAALNANTAAILGNAGSTTTVATDTPAATTTKGKGKAKDTAAETPAKPKVSQEEMVAALELVKEKINLDAAKKLITEVGGVSKRAEIPADKYEAVYEAAKKAVEEAEEGM